MNIPSLLPDNDKPESIRNWRIRVAAFSCGSWALTVFFFLPALIGVPFSLPVLGQVAWAKDQQELKEELTEIKAALLAQSILMAHKEKCDSESGGRYSPYWAENIRKLRDDYARLTGRYFELPPSC